jgi:hypothetical protein
MFTRITTALLVVLGITSGALAATAHRQHADPFSAYGAASGAPAAMRHRPHSPNPAWDVYNSLGYYIGSDPDPLIRDELRRDSANDR